MAGPKKTASKASKGSSSDITVGTTVLYKLKGYPAWPGKVVDMQEVGSDVVKDKPKTGDHVCVRFYPKGDHSWARRVDCKVLTPEDIDAYVSEPHRKSGELLDGYKLAADPTEWEANLDRQRQEYSEAMEGVDELEDDDDEDEVGTSSGAKKRKKAAAGAKDSKAGKKAKVEKKPKATTSKKGGKAKSSANIESEEEAEPAKAKGTAKKAADDTDQDSGKVKDWRHKLQRAFLGKNPPAEKDMPNCDQYFTTIEAYDDMTIEQLQTSKIGKVMRKIQVLDSIPRDEDFHFKERAKKLLDKWQSQLNKAGASEDAPAPEANGAESKEDASEPKKEDAAAADEAPVEEKKEDAKEEQKEEKPAVEEDKKADEEDKKEEEKEAKEDESAEKKEDEKAEKKEAEDVEMKEPEANGDKAAEDGEAAPAESS